MSLATFSSDYLIESFTLVDNLFINEYLTDSNEAQIKVYLYGLYLCSQNGQDNSLENMSSALNIAIDDITEAYVHFEDLGLVQIVSLQPFEVKYLSFKRGAQPAKRYKSEKWNEFNAQLQQLFKERMLSPHEYNEYYSFIDSYKIEKDAMLMIVKYCIDLKGMSVTYPYILTVARNWVADGVKTVADVEQRLTEYETQTEDMREVLNALRRKGGAEIEEKQLLKKWKGSWGFDLPAILAAAKSLKASKTFNSLDKRLDEFYKNNVFSEAEIKDYLKNRDYLYTLAAEIVNKLGLYYQSLEQVIEVYISPWRAKGFEDAALKSVARQCFVTGVRTLDGMDKMLLKFYESGLLSEQSIKEYIAAQLEMDKRIKQIIEAGGRTRSVTVSDREFYRTWSSIWGFSDEVILYAASLSAGRIYPNTYINQLLSTWKNANVKTVKDAETLTPKETFKTTKAKESVIRREYTDEEIKSVITNIDDIEI